MSPKTELELTALLLTEDGIKAKYQQAETHEFVVLPLTRAGIRNLTDKLPQRGPIPAEVHVSPGVIEILLRM